MRAASRLPLYAGLLYNLLVWASAFVVVKRALAGMHPLALVGWRFTLAAACLLPFAGPARGLGRALKPGAALAALLLALYIPHTLGLRFTSAANSGFLTGCFILFVPILMPVLEGRPAPAGQWTAAMLALAGVGLVTGGPSELNAGDLLTVGSTVAYAAHLLATGRWVRAEGSVAALAFVQMALAGAVCLLFCAATGIPLAAGDAGTARAVLYLAFLPTLSALLVQMTVQRALPPLTVALVFSLEPLVAGLFAWTLGGEAFKPRAALGGAMIVAAIALGETCAGGVPESRGDPAGSSPNERRLDGGSTPTQLPGGTLPA